MYIPVVPSVPNTTIINKNIIYNDTILPLREMGSNIKVSRINDIDENDFELCLKIILESNPNVIFNTIQYSRKDKIIYFYTNKDISIKKWIDNKLSNHSPLSNQEIIKDEIDKLLNNKEDNKKYINENAISLYDMYLILNRKAVRYEILKNNYKELFDSYLKSRYTRDFYCNIEGFDYNKKELKMNFHIYYTWIKIVFKKNNDDLYVSKSDSYYKDEIFSLLSEKISNFFDELLKYEDYYTQRSEMLSSLNSFFKVDIGKYEVSVYLPNKNNKYLKDFDIKVYSYNNEFDYKCNSNNTLNSIKGRGFDIFKNIFINIEDCPHWMKKELYQKKEEQLEKIKREEEKKQEEERYFEILREEQEKKEQRRLALKRKLFPWIKNK